MPINEEDMEFVGEIFCRPMTLIINFSLFQYLATFYFKRRSEVRGLLLIGCAFGGFAALVPYAHPNEMVVGHLNDISETFSVLTFLIQIVIVGRDVNKKVRIKSLRYVSIAGEMLVLLGLFVVALNLVEVMMPSLDVSALDGFDNVFENITLWFILFARFYYIILSRGLKETLQTRRLDLVLYLLFITHEYPFVLLEELTGVSWESTQALWNRLTILFCILLTIREKLSSKSSKLSKLNNTGFKNTTQGPQEKSLYVSEETRATSVAVTRRGISLKSLFVGAAVRPVKGK